MSPKYSINAFMSNINSHTVSYLILDTACINQGLIKPVFCAAVMSAIKCACTNVVLMSPTCALGQRV